MWDGISQGLQLDRPFLPVLVVSLAPFAFVGRGEGVDVSLRIAFPHLPADRVPRIPEDRR
jgi:hypothetical protein